MVMQTAVPRRGEPGRCSKGNVGQACPREGWAGTPRQTGQVRILVRRWAGSTGPMARHRPGCIAAGDVAQAGLNGKRLSLKADPMGKGVDPGQRCCLGTSLHCHRRKGDRLWLQSLTWP